MDDITLTDMHFKCDDECLRGRNALLYTRHDFGPYRKKMKHVETVLK